MRTLRMLTLALGMLAACDSIDDPLAVDEPIVVRQAEFKRGALPAGTAEPRITSFSLSFGVLRPGTRNAQVIGRASDSAYSVGIRFADQGSGFWVQPVGAEDLLIPGELNWQLSLDAATEIEPGLHQLEVVAFDEAGRAGAKQTLPVCITADLPDNQNACNPKSAPPLVVASLTWDADADLDLSVVGPDGTRFDRSKRSLLANGKVVARLDNDGVSGCLADGRRRESFVWNDVPPLAGTWNVYANIFDACGRPAVNFTLTLYQRQANADGTFTLAPIKTVGGTFPRQQANGGAGQPLFLTNVDFR